MVSVTIWTSKVFETVLVSQQVAITHCLAHSPAFNIVKMEWVAGLASPSLAFRLRARTRPRAGQGGRGSSRAASASVACSRAASHQRRVLQSLEPHGPGFRAGCSEIATKPDTTRAWSRSRRSRHACAQKSCSDTLPIRAPFSSVRRSRGLGLSGSKTR